MLAYTVRRLLLAVPILATASLIVFTLVAFATDPLERLKTSGRTGTEAALQRETERLYLDRNIFERYWLWLTGQGGNGDIGIIRGKWGPSSRAGQDIGSELLARSWVTLRLVFVAVLVALIFAVIAGVVMAVKQYTKIDYSLTLFGFLALSIPSFWFAILLKNAGIAYNDATGTRTFFTIGEKSPDTAAFTTWQSITDTAGHMILPTLSLVLISYAALSRYQRGSMLEVLNSDYVRLARAKGLRNRQVMTRHALRTALIPIVTVAAIGTADILGGAVITETVYEWRGLGRFLVDSVNFGDAYATLAWLMLAGTFIIIFNLVADLLYAVLDPRIRYE